MPEAAVSPGYRPALDGIRAIAVLSVLAYHLQLPLMRGGFLGVDIFFVLSGYLITGLLLDEHAASGRISLSRFWARRARRLFPALLLMIVVVALGIRILRPVTEWPTRAQDAIWTLLYAANWHQVVTSEDYFAQWGGTSPLRHMWSIAIEEQFYLVWPIVMTVLLGRRARGWLLSAIAVAALASAAATMVLFDPANPTRAYVGTDTRAQELLVGAALAAVVRRDRARGVPGGRGAVQAGALAAVGIALALVALPDSSPFSVRGGLAVSLAVAAVLWSVESEPESLLAHGLSVRPLAWVGKVSYGVYLWHWPAILLTPTLLVMLFGGRGLRVAEDRARLGTACIAVTLLITIASYYLVERPLRHGVRVSRLRLRWLALAGVAAGGAALYGVSATLAVPPDLLAQVTQSGTPCEAKMDDGKAEVHTCLVVDAGPGRPVVALMGDSIAKSLNPAFTRVSRAHGWTFVAAAHNRCTVVQHWLGVGKWDDCYHRVPVIQREVLSYHPALIVVSDNWLPMESYDDAGVLLARYSPAHIADVERRLDVLVDELTSSGPLLVLMRFTPQSAPLDCLDEGFAGAARCRAPGVGSYFDLYNAMLDRVAGRRPDRVRTIDLTDALCPGNQCGPRVDGLILRYDTLHFSAAGAAWAAPHLERKLAEAGVRLDL